MTLLAPATLKRLGTLTPAEFLRDHWQQKPLFVKNAVPELAGLLDGDDLAGLACMDGVEARIVRLAGDRRRAQSWSLQRGPFGEDVFATLGERNWTLLVQAVDHYLPEAAELLDRFNFLPHWRIDDLMVSYAVDGGGVGPHYDSYDVFLIQGRGVREWKIGPAADDRDLLPHPELRILKDMPVEQTFVCEPGDLLYLPPRLAHWGIARGECMTWSVGFRAAADRELLDALCDRIVEDIPEGARFSDAGRKPARHQGELAAADVQALRRRLLALIDAPGTFADFLARFLSEPKYLGHAPAEGPRLTAAALRQQLAAGNVLLREPASRFLFTTQPAALYVDGQRHVLASPAATGLARLIADRRSLPAADAAAALSDPAATALLLDLLHSGHLMFPEQS
jgi:50S ribosomal protein L16 3-hydroxylase